MLALNASGISVYAKSVPNLGKTTAAILGLLSTPPKPAPEITNLVLVPTPALADHYKDLLVKLSGNNGYHQVLYRTGTIDEDEKQHSKIMSSLKRGEVNTVIATPQRLLDYISFNPSLLSLQNISQCVIDELDVFGSPNALETLLEYIVLHGTSDPIFTLMATQNTTKDFQRLPELIAKSSRPMYEVAEPDRDWTGKLVEHFNAAVHDISGCTKRVKEAWTGPGLVVPPPGLSALELQNRLKSLEGAVVVQPAEVSGLNIENLENIYMLGEHSDNDINRMKWMLNGTNRNLHIFKE